MNELFLGVLGIKHSRHLDCRANKLLDLDVVVTLLPLADVEGLGVVRRVVRRRRGVPWRVVGRGGAVRGRRLVRGRAVWGRRLVRGRAVRLSEER